MSRSYKKNPGYRRANPIWKKINEKKVRNNKDFDVDGGAYRRLVYHDFWDDALYNEDYCSYEQFINRQQPTQKYFSRYSSYMSKYLTEEEMYDWWAKTYLRK